MNSLWFGIFLFVVFGGWCVALQFIELWLDHRGSDRTAHYIKDRGVRYDE
jgi:hypothetical protein